MKIEAVLTNLSNGKKVRRSAWMFKVYIYLKGNNLYQHVEKIRDSNFEFCYLDVSADDWEIYEEPTTFLEAIKALKEGKIIKNRETGETFNRKIQVCCFNEEDFNSDSWEIVQ